MSGAISIRPAAESDLDEIWRIQSASLPAVQWNVADYLRHECLVATVGDRLAGFVVARHTAPDELEILNAAVDPPLRRRGVARSLMQQLVSQHVERCIWRYANRTTRLRSSIIRWGLR